MAPALAPAKRMANAELCSRMHDDSGPAQQESDSRLLSRYCASGDRAAMEMLFERHVDCAYRVAFALCGNAADAEDIVQTAFVQVLTRGDRSLRHDSNVKGWIMTIVTNAARMKLREEASRRQREIQTSPPLSQDSAADPAQAEVSRAAVGALKALPALYRAPVALHCVEGFSIAEISAALVIPEKTIRSQISRGLEQLRDVLGAAGFTTLAVAALPAVLAQAPLESAPHSLLAAVKTKTGIALLAKPALVAKPLLAAKTVLLAAGGAALLAVAAVVYHSRDVVHPLTLTPGSTGADAPPSSATLAVAEAEPEPTGIPDASLAAILKQKIRVDYRRDFLNEIAYDLEQRVKLKCAFPVTVGSNCFSLERESISVEDVLKTIARDGKLKLEYHGDTALFWSRIDPKRIDALEAKLNGKDFQQRCEAACDLGNIADPRASALLLKVFSDNDGSAEKMRSSRYALLSLLSFRYTLFHTGFPADLVTHLLAEPDGPDGEFAAGRIVLLGATRDPRAESRLIAALQKGSVPMRQSAANALAHYPSDAVTTALSVYLSDKDQTVCSSVVAAIGAAHSSAGFQLLLAQMKNDNMPWEVASALTSADAAKIEPEIQRLAKGNDVERGNLALLLGFMHGPGHDAATAMLLTLLKDPSTSVRNHACWAFPLSDHPDAADALISIVEAETDANVQQNMIEALASVRSARAGDWLFANYKRFENAKNPYAIRALGATRDDRALAILRPMLESKDANLSQFAAQGLFSLRSAEAIDAVASALKNPDDYTRWNAAITLSRLPDPRAIDAIIPFLDHAPREWMPGVAAVCLRGYINVSPLLDREKILIALEKYDDATKVQPSATQSGDF